jgi:hypothetical protein
MPRALQLHRLGSSLNMHFHYHLVVLDGVSSGADDGDARFPAAIHLTPAHWLDLQRVVQRRVLRPHPPIGHASAGPCSSPGSTLIPPGGVLPLLCPGCGGDMNILAFLTDPPVVSSILLHG